MIALEIVLLTIVLVTSFFMISKKMKTDFLIKYLSFVLINSFFIFYLFHYQSALLVLLICAMGLILTMKATVIKKSLLILLVGIGVSLYRVPLSSAEFDDYVKDTYGIECLTSECVEVIKIEDGNKVELKMNEYTIQGYSFNWYYIFSKGELMLNDKSIKAVNVMGLWFPLRKGVPL